ncbi:MAG: type II toxin-antitoxin system RelE/ParE family toxin [Pirellulales bacterium]|nr:type II toxin-antitoxin system RelE/ParE family toxin [Pirellulales bacterium]
MKRWRMDADASADLLNIYTHVADDNPGAAHRLIELFHEKFLLLTNHSLLGETRSELVPNLRSFSFKNYVIFYLPGNDGIRIVRIIHSAQDVDAIF